MPDSKRLPLRERNRQRVYQRIVDAAFELFSQDGYHQTTMDMIAEQAEVSRGTLFNYFPAKSSLLLPFANEIYNKEIYPRVLTYLAQKPSTTEALRFLFAAIYEHIFSTSTIDRTLQLEFFSTKSPLHGHPHDIMFLQTLITIVEYGQQKGEVRTDLSAEKTTRYIGTLYIALLHNQFQPTTSTPYAEEIELLLSFLQGGLLL